MRVLHKTALGICLLIVSALTVYAVLVGDANSDGRVDGLDYVVWLNHFGTTVSDGPASGDFSQNGSVGEEDYSAFAANFGQIGSTGTPTPITASVSPTSIITQMPTYTPTMTPTITPTSTQMPTKTPTPTQTQILSSSGVPCSSLTGIEKRFPCAPLVVGNMPELATTSNAWNMFKNILYPGYNDGNGVNERFFAVSNPVGSGVVIKNVNVQADTEQHTTVGTSRDLPYGTTECSAFRWLWNVQGDLQPQKDWILIWQQQQAGSPIVAIEVDKSTNTWFFRSRNGSDSGLKITLGPVGFGHWAYFTVCTHIADAPDGWTKIWYSQDAWPDVSLNPAYQRTGIDTDQSTSASDDGHNTIGMYAGHSSTYTGSYTGYFDRYGRATTPQRAIEIAGN